MLDIHLLKHEHIVRKNKLIRFFRRDGNKFINKQLNKAIFGLINSLELLSNFTGQYFFTHPVQSKMYCLLPDLNVERGGNDSMESRKIYNEKAAELNKLVIDVEQKYSNYRNIVKKILYL